MRKLITFLSLGLFAACVSLSFSGLSSAMACPASNSASLDQPSSFTTGSDRFFSFTATAGWSTVGTPFLGAVQVGDSVTFHVTVTSIDPAYFFPSACQNQTVAHYIQGSLDGYPVTTGGVELVLDVTPSPNNAHSEGFTTINYPY